MAPTKAPGANKRLGRISLGRRFVRFKVKDHDRQFTVHEDLICSRSAFFRKKLQNNHKEIEGNCAICHEALDPSKSDITFCKAGCGQNVHEECYKRRSETQQTCPSCRSPWEETEGTLIFLDATLVREAVDIYLEWLYSGGKLPIEDLLQLAPSGSIGNAFIALLQVHTVGIAAADASFKSAVVQSLGNLWKELACIPSKAVWYAYFTETILSGSRKLLVDLYVAKLTNKVWFTKRSRDYPLDFVLEVADACNCRMGTRPTTDSVLAKYIEEEEEEEEDVAA